MRMVNAIVQLRRDNEANFNKIKDSFVPYNGEVVLVDTSNGLRAKVGDGVHKYKELSFTDEAYIDAVINGYCENGVFYKDTSKQEVLPNKTNKVYVDNAHSKVYYFNGSRYVTIQETLTTANDREAGLVRMYSTLGNNIDGTMTQKAITDEFQTRYKTSVDLSDELLIFSL